jgi:hypothetical protein
MAETLVCGVMITSPMPNRLAVVIPPPACSPGAHSARFQQLGALLLAVMVHLQFAHPGRYRPILLERAADSDFPNRRTLANPQELPVAQASRPDTGGDIGMPLCPFRHPRAVQPLVAAVCKILASIRH